MNYKEAQEQLRHALRHQKTISISKLSRILQSMNVSLRTRQDKKRMESKRVIYLKNEIAEKDKRIQRLSYLLNQQKIKYRKLKERSEDSGSKDMRGVQK